LHPQALALTQNQAGDQLIFLICQPRSGSTMLQLLLSEHPAIASLPEPWFMLHMFYALRKTGLATEYDARHAYRGLTDFLAALPNGRETYVAALRAAALVLYETALRSSGKQFFLDKTPRYYLIIPELKEAFPAATFLFLVRNPLDVFSSVFDTQGGRWTDLAQRAYLHDLVTGPRAIFQATSAAEDKNVLIHYEDLVTDPERHLKHVCRAVGVAYDPDMVRYSKFHEPGKFLGDWTGVHLHQAPVKDYVDIWLRRLDTPWKRGLALAYLRQLGPETVEGLGYRFSELESGLLTAGAHFGSGRRRWRLLSTPRAERTWWASLRLLIARSLQERGLLRTLLRATYIGLLGRAPTRRHDAGTTD
jgi:hypothetical protein